MEYSNNVRFFYLRFQTSDRIDVSVLAHSSAIAEEIASPPLPKKKKQTPEDERRACWSALMDSIRPQTDQEAFGSYVSASLSQIKDEHLTKKAKCEIQLVLTKALTEHATKELGKPVSTTTSNTHGSVDVLFFDDMGHLIDQNDIITED